MYSRAKFLDDLLKVLKKHQVENNDSMQSALDSVLIAADESQWLYGPGDTIAIAPGGKFMGIHYDKAEREVYGDGHERGVPVGATGQVMEIKHADKSHWDAEMLVAVKWRHPRSKEWRNAILYCAGDEGFRLVRRAPKQRVKN